MILISTSAATTFGSGYMMAPNRDWQDALAYIRDNTPDDSLIMTQWGWGYWMLDLGERRPFVDNGYYGHLPANEKDIALAFCATDPSEAAQIMKKYGADYLIFCTFDLKLAKIIVEQAGLGEEQDSFPAGSLVVPSLDSKFESGGGLEVVYRSAPNSEVVILGLSAP